MLTYKRSLIFTVAYKRLDFPLNLQKKTPFRPKSVTFRQVIEQLLPCIGDFSLMLSLSSFHSTSLFSVVFRFTPYVISTETTEYSQQRFDFSNFDLVAFFSFSTWPAPLAQIPKTAVRRRKSGSYW